MERERIYILCMLFIFLIYSYVFGNHNSFANILISLAAIGCLYTILSMLQVYKKKDKEDNFEDIIVSDMKQKLLIDQSISWLEHDDFLSNVVTDLYPIARYDIEILKSVILDMNKFLKIYYTSMSSKDNKVLLYKTITKNQSTIQSLEDKKTDILDELMNLVYVLPHRLFYNDINVPEVSYIIKDYFDKKINLLSVKVKMKQSKIASASL